MPKTRQSQLDAAARWNAKQDTITIRPPKEDGAQIRRAAQAAQQSMTQYIVQACKERIDRDK